MPKVMKPVDDIILVGTFDSDTQAYLYTLSQASPVRFFESPRVFLTNPYTEVLDKDRIGDAVGKTIDLTFQYHRTVFNNTTDRSDLNILCSSDARPLLPFLNSSLSGMDPSFLPYFTWLLDPNQSRASRHFVVSLANALHTDARPLRAFIEVVAYGHPDFDNFNPAVNFSAPTV